ncbi:MAG: hypothetical protein JWM59_3397 [Verrucomicrobiales bacterium]|nr:hypothetical protein [Verrucomicrobiales bacterium]
MYSEDSIQYALETTEVLHEPDRRIDTFGTTSFQFHLISELMDDVSQVRVRSGQIHAERPTILKPEPYSDLEFEGFGDQAHAFANWMKERIGKSALLQYGFSFRKSDVTESMVHDSLAVVTDRVVEDAKRSGNPLAAVILGVDDTWEICLLKFTIEMIQKSHRINLFDFKRRGLI